MPVVDNIRLEASPVLTMKGGPRFSTTVTQNGGGYRHTQSNWMYALWAVTLTFTDEKRDFSPIISFWLGQRGPEFPFYVKDPSDHSDAGYGTVELIEGVYRLVKTYPHQLRPYKRLITRPIAGTVDLSDVPGAPVLDYETGIVTGATGSGAAAFEFDVPMAFINDDLKYDYDAGGITSVSLDLEEVRV